ncbi:hypothetical protein C1H46_013204 [Malus baccata]|uniref:Uncharacterized protein n=1 Tax=Malus baccata TaxID=106549 RepID=A0A540MQX9_MALBA|nr:hypothetical protein C1H46_013204 [Malus baccata]
MEWRRSKFERRRPQEKGNGYCSGEDQVGVGISSINPAIRAEDRIFNKPSRSGAFPAAPPPLHPVPGPTARTTSCVVGRRGLVVVRVQHRLLV